MILFKSCPRCLEGDMKVERDSRECDRSDWWFTFTCVQCGNVRYNNPPPSVVFTIADALSVR